MGTSESVINARPFQAIYEGELIELDRVGRSLAVTLQVEASKARELHLRWQRASAQTSPFKLACPSLPTMMRSCMEMPSGFATSTICCVIWMHARERVRLLER